MGNNKVLPLKTLKYTRGKSKKPSPNDIFIDLDTNVGYNSRELEELDRTLDTIPTKRRDAILATVIAESGANPYAVGDGGLARGYFQWHSDRWPFEGDAPSRVEERERQGRLIGESLTDVKQWHHGGKGSGYNSAAEAQRAFYGDDTDAILKALTFGYIRPKDKIGAYNRRKKIYDQLQSRRKNKESKINKFLF